MSETQQFFDSYPEAIDTLPVFSLDQVLRWIGDQEPFPYEGFFSFPSFPIAQKEYSLWFAKNIFGDDSLKNKHKEEIIEKYRDLFHQRIQLLLEFEGPKTPEKRLQDIQALREEFFLYPVELEKELLGRHKKKQIDSFEDIERALTKNTPLRNFREAARKKSLGSIASFVQEKHLSPHFSGFVENVQILSEPISVYSDIIFQAQGAYIQNGKIIWSIHSADSKYSSRPVNWNDSIVRWYSPHFVLEEVYLGDYRENTKPELSSQRRIAKYRFDDPRIQQVTITQQLTVDKKEEFIIQIEKGDKTLIIHRATRAINGEIYTQLKENSMYLSEIENVIRLVDEIQENEKNQKRPQ